MGLMASVREWLERRKARGSGGGLLGQPGSTQQPGRASGGPAEGPTEGGSASPKGPDGSVT